MSTVFTAGHSDLAAEALAGEAPGRREPHAASGFARVRDGVLVYPALV